jgi:iron complex outermembrane receptor protein
MGFNYRYISTRPSNSAQHFFTPPERGLNQVALFVEDQFELKPGQLYVSVGLRTEYYSLTGWEPLPTLRLSWTPSRVHTLWTSFSRGYRSPSTADSDLTIQTPFLIAYPALVPETEKVLSYQGGYRGILTPKIRCDLAGFFNQYSDLATYESEQVQPVLITRRANLMEGTGWGGEAALTWQSFEWWRWRASYAYLKAKLSLLSQSQEQASVFAQDRSPQHLFQFWWSFQLASKVSADAMVRFVDERAGGLIPAYWSGDLRIGYRPSPSVELAIVGQNLFEPHHFEFSRSPGFPANSEIPRGFYTSVTWHF